ncbi:hypothetical protein L6164_000860 [Bauhinia variegata]|uniref:Uncharacterized protein n=1 Tax=Bauhinia variegata TaxID=167791 RepID=A0ACB9Q7D3_BAUVA|nr:hypothetical protein L6164_000860 [Bauhinia variegata]
MASDKSLVVEMIKYSSPLSVIRALVVDSDSTCLEIVSKMLRVLGYQVVTAKKGADALNIVQQKGNELHLVLMEAHLPDMEINELIQKIKRISTLPFSSKVLLGSIV